MPVPESKGEPSKNSDDTNLEERPPSPPPPPLSPPLVPTSPRITGYNRFNASNQPDTYTTQSSLLLDPLTLGRMATGIPTT